jgi:hypothetical protein
MERHWLSANFPQYSIRGSHHIFTRSDIPEILNLQPQGTNAKRYQVKQVRAILITYLAGENDVD